MDNLFPQSITRLLDCDPFGMMIVGRNWVAGSEYGYGFNNQEQDNEVYGNGILNSAEFWLYNTQIARRWVLDRKHLVSVSLYAVFNNNPINIVDRNGDIIEISGDDDFVRETKALLNQLNATEQGRELLKVLETSHTVYKIIEAPNAKNTSYDQITNTVAYDDNPWLTKIDGGAHNELLALAHELNHAYLDELYHLPSELSKEERLYVERSAVKFANYINSVYEIGDFRLRYDGIEGGQEGQLFSNNTDKYFNPKHEKITNFLYTAVLDVSPAVLGNENSDNTTVKIDTVVFHYEVSYSKTITKDGTTRTETVKENAKYFKTK